MQIRISQQIVEKDISTNLKKFFAVIEDSQPGEWVLFPEGGVSGYYPEDEDYLAKLNWLAIQDGVEKLKTLAKEKNINIIFGTAYKDGNDWFNTAQFVGRDGSHYIYKKVNLSTLDRKCFKAGDRLEVFESDGIRFGMQLCRDNAFPEQWKVLKKKGAQVVFHINNAIAEDDNVRKHLFVARAFENQYFVMSVNNASKPSTLSSLAISAFGKILYESTSQKEEVGIVEIDPTDVGDSYLKQERRDVVDLNFR